MIKGFKKQFKSLEYWTRKTMKTRTNQLGSYLFKEGAHGFLSFIKRRDLMGFLLLINMTQTEDETKMSLFLF